MVTIEIKKNTALVLLGFAALLAGVFVINAAWTAPAAWHDSSAVKVSIGGTDYSLQEAIDGDLIGGSSGGLECRKKTTTASTPISLCCNLDEIATSHGVHKTSTGKPEPTYRSRMIGGADHDLQCMAFDNAGSSYTKQVLCCKKA